MEDTKRTYNPELVKSRIMQEMYFILLKIQAKHFSQAIPQNEAESTCCGASHYGARANSQSTGLKVALFRNDSSTKAEVEGSDNGMRLLKALDLYFSSRDISTGTTKKFCCAGCPKRQRWMGRDGDRQMVRLEEEAIFSIPY